MATKLAPGLLATYSSSCGTKRYSLTVGKDDVLYCSCPAWKFSKKNHKTCKHVQAFLAEHETINSLVKTDDPFTK